MSTINTNIQSLNAQRNLASSAGSLSTSMQRLSSGLRVNSAKDDAAGLAISERMNAQVKGLNVAARNASDGISLSQTAEGAMAEIGNNLQRIRELAVQSSNATNSEDDRTILQKEVTQLQAEIQRVATQTEFNGTKLLDGTFNSKAFQVGANAGQIITFDAVASAQTSTLGSTRFASDTVGGVIPAAGNATTGLIINGTAIRNLDAVTVSPTVAATAAALATAINEKAGETGVFATVNSGNGVTLSSMVAGKNSVVTGGTGTGLVTTAVTKDVNAAVPTPADLLLQEADDIDIKTFVGAQRAISISDNSLKAINSARADMGAIQNRFSSVVQNLQTSSENLSAARGRIVDADFAKETANLSRAQILQQAGTAMVAQANQLPQGVLSLLR
jgi:flagellin